MYVLRWFEETGFINVYKNSWAFKFTYRKINLMVCTTLAGKCNKVSIAETEQNKWTQIRHFALYLYVIKLFHASLSKQTAPIRKSLHL